MKQEPEEVEVCPCCGLPIPACACDPDDDFNEPLGKAYCNAEDGVCESCQ